MIATKLCGALCVNFEQRTTQNRARCGGKWQRAVVYKWIFSLYIILCVFMWMRWGVYAFIHRLNKCMLHSSEIRKKASRIETKTHTEKKKFIHM